MNKISEMNHKQPSQYTVTPLLAALLVVFSPLAAQAAAPVIPGAGDILKQNQPVMPPAPSSTGTGLTIEAQGGAKLPSSAPFLVQTIRIAGNTQFDTSTLHALVADVEGKTLTLGELGKVVARITDFYHSHGYPLARAIIPAQGIQDGVVDIEVIEARYGKIRLDNSSRVNDPLLAATLSPLQGGQVISQADMDRALLLLSDIPGVAVNATLTPGESVGTSDLLVNARPVPAVMGNVALDNNGNRYTGRARLGGTVNVIDPLHHGDILSVSGLSSGSGMNYGRLAYDTLVSGQGTRIGGSYSALHYRLGGPLSSLDAHGTAQVESLWAKQPLVRSRDVNLYGQIQYDQLQLRDHVDASAIDTDRHLGNWTLSVAGDARDGLLSGAVSTWSVGLTAGRVGFDNAQAQLADAASASTQGRFTKWNLNLARLQSLSPRDGVYLSFSGQWANANLDASQKMTVGGPYSVRAYDVGAMSGDIGYLGTLELRHDLGAASGGQWQAVAFADSAHVTVNKNTWAAGPNSATLSGAGVGLNWAGPNQWSAKAYLAARIGSVPVLVGSTASVRAWVELSRAF
ncbi:ShlB/FhaC/HecB family hemolysin secretion/activation protein [Collimonas sp. OK412]|uniref:ShlB/FhaC/HecB family hemolysin secretion/activation protein n=1 Tax=Collimonas sp. (strain OK412) TaxID=1801619 RepID=UPI000B88A264|nr:ShlB/FhaC/HecB family hemolysin secretion/activation protein [Collimonas sp. OK412]